MRIPLYLLVALLPIVYAEELTLCFYKPENCEGEPQYIMVYSSVDMGKCYKYMELGGDPMKTNGKSFYVRQYLKDKNGKPADFYGFDWNCGASLGTCDAGTFLRCGVTYDPSNNACLGSTCNGGNSNCACSGQLGVCNKSPLTTFSQAQPMLIVVKGGESACPGKKKSGASSLNASITMIASSFAILSVLVKVFN
jgi:hypothetical protein